MTCAMIVHCFCQNNEKLEIVRLRVSSRVLRCLTYSATDFRYFGWRSHVLRGAELVYNGLVDVRLVNEHKFAAACTLRCLLVHR